MPANLSFDSYGYFFDPLAGGSGSVRPKDCKIYKNGAYGTNLRKDISINIPKGTIQSP